MCCALALACVNPVAAHHSTVEFDYTKAYVLKGTVKELQWTNPHSWVQMLVSNPDGTSDQWGFEIAAPLFNIRMGWSKDSVKPGDQVTVVFCPSRTRARGTLMQIFLPDGSVLNSIANNSYKGTPYERPEDLESPPPLPSL